MLGVMDMFLLMVFMVSANTRIYKNSPNGYLHMYCCVCQSYHNKTVKRKK